MMRLTPSLVNGAGGGAQPERFLQPAWRVFADDAEEFLACEVCDARPAHEFFDERFAFFDDVHGFVLGAEIAQEICGQGVGHAEAQDARVRQNFLHVLIGNPRSDHADFVIRAFFDAVEGAGLGVFGESRQRFLNFGGGGSGDRSGQRSGGGSRLNSRGSTSFRSPTSTNPL
jgi:hypothetical protein